jgi:uncharacterized protein (UPF0210 family)
MRRYGKERVVSSIQAFALRVVTDAIQGKASAQKMLVALIERFVPIAAEVAPTGKVGDKVDRLFEKLDLMSKRNPPGEK